jgi:hypothetical protein
MNIATSYANSGRTWLKSMTNYIGIPIAYTHFGAAPFFGFNVEKLISYYEKYLIKYKNDKIMFLYRDPRDTVVSNIFQYIWRIHGGSTKDTTNLSEFIRSKEHGIEKIIIYNLYWKEYNTNKICISYEDLVRDTAGELKRISEYFNHEYDADNIDEAVDIFSFDKMREREISRDNSVNNTKKFKELMDRTNVNEPESFKCRKGKIGGYTDYMNENDIKYCNELLEKYNYFERMK